MEKAYLILASGEVLAGRRIGAAAESTGELVFTTGMCGYLETLTDPSYAGQIVMQTFPLIGNYGVIPADFEGESAVRGYVVRECCAAPSNFRAEGTLDDYLKAHNIPGLAGVDTRYLTRLIRERGVVNARISASPETDMEALAAYRVSGAVAACSAQHSYTVPAAGEARYSVALIDYGAKRGIVRELQKRRCAVTIYPQDTAAETILAGGHDGLMLSNGPGDPADNLNCIAELSALIGRIPTFGICLGHQLSALAMGGATVKMKYGHRGVNQPVREVGGQRTYITSQNHGYAVLSESLRGVGEPLFENANDSSCEGLVYPGKSCFTVQFHPEARGGPQDTAFLFDRFIAMMEGETSYAKR